MPYALNLTPDAETSLDVERVLAGLPALGIAEEQLVTQYGPCVTLLVIEESVHPDDLLELLRRHVPRTASIPLTLVEPCIIAGNPPTLSLRASPVQALLTLHNAIFRSVPEQAVHLHYRPAYWQPHLKLANVSPDPAVSRALVDQVAAQWSPMQGWLVAFEVVHYPPVEAIWHGRLLPARDGLEDRAFQAALAGLLPAALAVALGGATGATVATADLLDEAMLAMVLGGEPRDRRAVVSVWALEAFEAVLPHVIAGAVLLGRVPGGEAGWVIGEGRVSGLQVPVWHEGSFGDFAAAMLSPFVAHVAERGGVSRRVLWSNAGHIVEVFVGMLEREAGVSARSTAIRALLAQPAVGAAANGLFAPVRYVDGQRIRRVCCLRFLVPSWRICLICPLPEGHAGRKREERA